ncbi:MBL fold metallo-hydrolase [Rhodococcus maanshanensis]|uniref:Glyoxylase, beta-lactamase superfamily II n=1 Tax=Rhodococcus maanshanensis TaxID=183556 RepID=A0A1H7V2D9_9NOCA|nr:MBL fold metallo-hydrolase [Rhodococcus maanshanensis]SEM03306.1 Glyoxylase, beta-lactamase superfamily II [Rhodococcus maanshanensis]
MTISTGNDGLLGVIDVPVMSLPINATRVYLIEGVHGPILIDAGWDDETAWQALSSGLASLGLNIGNTEGIILTHHHPDHSGLAGRIQEASGAWIAMHELDADLMEGMRTTESHDSHLSWELDNLASAGAPRSALDSYSDCGGSYSMAIPTAEVDRRLRNGDTIATAAGDLTALWLPGHTHGHMGALMEKQRMVFTGDHVLSRTSPHVGEFVFPVDEHRLLHRYLESLSTIRELVRDGYSLRPAHEAIEINWDTRIDEIVDHHHRRLDNLRAVITDGHPRSLWQIAESMTWATRWEDIPPLGWQLALSECSAHLTYLIDIGEVTANTSDDGPSTFITRNS